MKDNLNKTEEDILKLVKQNKTLKQIAKELYISTHTVHAYLCKLRIMERLDDSSE